MASSTGHPAPVSPETYWKRRVFVLAGVLVVVALIAWACSGSSSGDGEQQASVDPGSDSDTEESPSPSITPSESPDDDEETDEETGDGDAAGDEEGAGGDASNDGGGGGGQVDVPEPRRAEDPCRPQDIVVTMEATETSYGSGDKPKIRLTMVNIGEQTCTLDVGPENMEIRITSGDDEVYSTAHCVDNGSRNEQLEQGRPYTATITWDRKRSWENCRDDDVTAGSGTYVAALHSDYNQGADNQTFRLT